MKILFIAMAESIHTARWISQIADNGWDIHLFPSIDYGIRHADLKNLTIHHSFFVRRSLKKTSLRYEGLNVLSNRIMKAGITFLKMFFPQYRIWQLRKVIRDLKPDIIHSLEFQAAGYLVLDAKRDLKEDFPTWIATNWGNDIYFFSNLIDHREKIKQILRECNYYSCECTRDVALAKKNGLKGRILPVMPNTGGFDLSRIRTYRKQSSPTSDRRVILVKGYQGILGRAFVALHALELNKKLLKGYEIAIFSTHATSEVATTAEIFTSRTGIPTRIIPFPTSHADMLKLHSQSRIYIGLSVSDGISTSSLEAMAMGSFPIQSYTSCAGEWIKDKVSGFLVPPEDPRIVANAIKRALSDDKLVNNAAKINFEIVTKRLNHKNLSKKAAVFYKIAMQSSKKLKGLSQ